MNWILFLVGMLEVMQTMQGGFPWNLFLLLTQAYYIVLLHCYMQFLIPSEYLMGNQYEVNLF